MRELGAAATTAARVELATESLTVRIALREDARAMIDQAMVRSSKTELKLTLEGIDYDRSPDVRYEVYLNLPKQAKKPSEKSVYYVGNLTFFEPVTGGAAHSRVRSFDVTKTILGLKLFKLWNDNEALVTFIVHPLVDRYGQPLPVLPGVRLRFNSAKIVATAPPS